MPKLKTPKIYLVSRPSVDWEQMTAFLTDEELPPVPQSIRAGTDGAGAIIETSARLCYMSFGRGRRDIEAFVNNLLGSKDGSVFEHVNYGFVATGISRSLSHELVRHRAGFAYSQRSQRYVDEGEAAFILPPALEGEGKEEAVRTFTAALRHIEYAYDGLVDSLGEVHKNINYEYATETKMFITANVRAWRHFIEMRAAATADLEIRRLALMILEILARESPLLFGDFSVSELADGSRIATPKYSKI